MAAPAGCQGLLGLKEAQVGAQLGPTQLLNILYINIDMVNVNDKGKLGNVYINILTLIFYF